VIIGGSHDEIIGHSGRGGRAFRSARHWDFLGAFPGSIRIRWPDLGRLVMLHRVGSVPIGESSVVVVASAPHRDAAFTAARFGIDTLKATAPIWKREQWDGGESWALEAQHVSDVSDAISGGIS
jgi:molybdopterin synthase catalytic subunit